MFRFYLSIFGTFTIFTPPFSLSLIHSQKINGINFLLSQFPIIHTSTFTRTKYSNTLSHEHVQFTQTNLNTKNKKFSLNINFSILTGNYIVLNIIFTKKKRKDFYEALTLMLFVNGKLFKCFFVLLMGLQIADT